MNIQNTPTCVFHAFRNHQGEVVVVAAGVSVTVTNFYNIKLITSSEMPFALNIFFAIICINSSKKLRYNR